jgi:hypothetical protein
MKIVLRLLCISLVSIPLTDNHVSLNDLYLYGMPYHKISSMEINSMLDLFYFSSMQLLENQHDLIMRITHIFNPLSCWI